MIIKTKKVYYCEYCGKHNLRSLAIHEKHCTGNPSRECRLCGRTDSVQPLIDKYQKQHIVEELKESDNFDLRGYKVIQEPKIEDIKDDVDCCPNCVLAIIRGFKTEYTIDFRYQYQEELKIWWDDVNSEVNYPDDY